MRFAKIIYVSISLSLILFSAYSAAALDVSSKGHLCTHKGYFKPGTAVALSYDYDGKTQPGELEDLTLTLEHYYSDGYISAKVLETNALHIMSHRTIENEKLEAGTNLSLPIQFSGAQLGEYFISLEVIYENLSGERNLRVLSLPIQIGTLNTPKNANTSSEKTKSGTITNAEKGLVILNAQEIIK